MSHLTFINNNNNFNIVTNIPSSQEEIKNYEEAYKTKSLYLSKSAHELKNVFITINSTIKNSSLIERNNSEKFRQRQRFLSSLCNYGMNLIMDINTANELDYTKNSNDQSNYNLIEALNFCLTIFQSRQEFEKHCPNVSIISDYKIPFDTRVRTISEVRLKQIIINLLSNAYKFTSKGEIKLSCLNTHGNKVRIKITDTGSGMTQDELKGLFKPFQKLESNKIMNYYGSGLGLCIVKDILQAFQIQLNYNSTKGKGTEFYFDIDYEYNNQIIDQKCFFTESVLKMMKDINSGKKDELYDKYVDNEGNFKDIHIMEDDDNSETDNDKYSLTEDKINLTNTSNNPKTNTQISNFKKTQHSRTTNPMYGGMKFYNGNNCKNSKFKKIEIGQNLMTKINLNKSLSYIERSNEEFLNLFFNKEEDKYNIFICDDEMISAVSTKKLIINYFKKRYPNGSLPEIYLLQNGIECLYQSYKFFINDDVVNLILMDQNMPFLNGNDTCSLIKNIRDLKNIKIYLLTSEDNKEDISKEANGIFSKPLTKGDIEKIMNDQSF